MIARIGNVIYWTATGVAMLWGLYVWFLAADIFFFHPTNRQLSENVFNVLALAVPAPIIWVVGRAAKYILAGK